MTLKAPSPCGMASERLPVTQQDRAQAARTSTESGTTKFSTRSIAVPRFCSISSSFCACRGAARAHSLGHIPCVGKLSK